jgi:hypothetical protein
MKIRSITLGTPAASGLAPAVERAGQLLTVVAARFAEAGYEVQTTRASLPPLTRTVAPRQELSTLAIEVDQTAQAGGVGYVALGPIRWQDDEARARYLASELPAALAIGERVFGAIETADAHGIRFEAVQASAKVIRALVDSTEQGFGNLRFAALARCPPDIPFFPAAYHEDDEPTFSLALQAADLAVQAFEQASSLDQAESGLTAALEAEFSKLDQLGSSIEADLGLRYAGADPTLAPFPDERQSVGAALERLGVDRFGAPGTLAGSALITRALRAVRGRRCGFAGLMLPVLEDSVLARRAAEGLYSWTELLLFSAVCGTGLDTLPLPGDISADELSGIILDVSALADALGKPLTCRLFPIPGKTAGQTTSFDFPYFANGGVLGLKRFGSAALMRRGLLSQGAPLE